jgi:iron complex outermembrane receptor protein
VTNNAKKISRFGLSASAAALSVVLAAAPAFAQAAPAEAAPADTDVIVVTGSLIKNPNLANATPVNVTTSDQIELKQNNTAEEILREIPGIVPSIGSAVNNGNGGASFVNLRGLGSNRNIVLLDGVRLVPAELNGRFDLNNIPLALIQRVDVLTGGASTTYGADAISGVVNFITRSDFSGIEATIGDQITEKGDGNVVKLDVTVGGNFDDGAGNAVFSIGYQQSDPVYQGARSFSVNQLSSFTGGISGSGTAVPSRFTNVNPTGADFISLGCGLAGQPACATGVQGTRPVNADGTAFQVGAATAAQGFNFNPYNIFQTPFERFNMYGAAHYDVSDALKVYTRGIFSKQSVNTIIAPSGAFGIPITVNLNNPYLTTALRNAFCARDTNNGVGYTPLYTPAQCAAAATATGPTDPNYRTVSTSVSRRAVEVGPRVSQFTTTFFDYRLGASGGITDSIDWDIWGSYGESENIQTQKGYTLTSRITQAALADSTTACTVTTNSCVPINLFGPAGSITPAMIGFISGTSQISTKTTLAQAHATISGDFGGFAVPMASDPISFAIAGEYREYGATQFSDALSKAGDLGGSGGAAPDIDGGYNVYEAIGELVVPLVQDKPFFENLQVSGGVRYSHYTIDAPTSPSFNTTTYKFTADWSPVKAVKIRGNYSHAVRAPNVAELFSPVNTTLTNLAADPCQGAAPVNNANLRAVCLAQGATAGQIGAILAPSAGQINSTGGGNLNLGPEKSNSYSFGVVLQPADLISNLSLSVDYYNIKITGAITQPTVGDAISACFGNITAASATNPACTVIRRNPNTGGLDGPANTTPGVFLTLSNLGKLATSGIDVVMNYSYDFDWAKLSLAVNGNWTEKSTFQATPSGTNRECTGYYSTNCASLQPKWQTSARATLSFSAIDLSLLWRHIDGFKQEPDDVINGNGPVFADFAKIKPFNYFDFSTRVGVSDNVTITFVVQNLLDKKPPIVGNTVGSTTYDSGNTYPSTYDALGRKYGISAKLKF